jgi:hypothetical protein
MNRTRGPHQLHDRSHFVRLHGSLRNTNRPHLTAAAAPMNELHSLFRQARGNRLHHAPTEIRPVPGFAVNVLGP